MKKEDDILVFILNQIALPAFQSKMFLFHVLVPCALDYIKSMLNITVVFTIPQFYGNHCYIFVAFLIILKINVSVQCKPLG